MRTFISIDIPEEIQGEIQNIQVELPEFCGKLTESENLHLTLKFLGEISDEKIEETRKRLRGIKYNCFGTEVGAPGFFDNVKEGKKYGPVWLHLSNCEGLQKKVDKSLDDLFPIEKRFMSHLTIARVKDVGDKRSFLRELSNLKTPKINFVVDSFRLKKSVLYTKGPKYEDIEKYNLI